ncbi:hypothetical protein CVS40_9288 [Lucilia cuprina]|nr:hypothetical protein CVS40_9288 [Lucilia cuprina]
MAGKPTFESTYRYDKDHKGTSVVYVDSYDDKGMRKYLSAITVCKMVMDLGIGHIEEVSNIFYGRDKISFKNFTAANNFMDDSRIKEKDLSPKILPHFVSKAGIVYDVRCYRFNHFAQHCKQSFELFKKCVNQHEEEILEDVDDFSPLRPSGSAGNNRNRHHEAIKEIHRVLPYSKAVKNYMNKDREEANARNTMREHQEILSKHSGLGVNTKRSCNSEKRGKTGQSELDLLDPSDNHSKAINILTKVSQDTSNIVTDWTSGKLPNMRDN